MSKTNSQACQWKHDDIDGGWDTECGEKFVFTCDGPKEHGFRFCYHCGKPIVLAGDREPVTPKTGGVKALASATGSASVPIPKEIIESLLTYLDDLPEDWGNYGQNWQRGYNQCRNKVAWLLTGKTPNGELRHGVGSQASQPKETTK